MRSILLSRTRPALIRCNTCCSVIIGYRTFAVGTAHRYPTYPLYVAPVQKLSSKCFGDVVLGGGFDINANTITVCTWNNDTYCCDPGWLGFNWRRPNMVTCKRFTNRISH